MTSKGTLAMVDSSSVQATTLKQAFRICNLVALTGAEQDRYKLGRQN